MRLHTHPRKKSLLLIGLVLLVSLLLFIFLTPPSGMFSFMIFFFLFFVGLFYVCVFGFNSKRQAMLFSGGVTLIMLLRALELRHWIYPLLILAIIISLELNFRKK